MEMKKIKQSVEVSPTPHQSEPIDTETQEQVVNTITEKIVLQPLIQPIQVQGESIPVTWQQGDLGWQETITEAETFAREAIAKPLEARGVGIYWYQIYDLSAARPKEYVIITPDVSLAGADYADDKVAARESRIEFVIQGKGKTYENYVLEISLEIVRLLEAEWAKSGRVYKISNTDFGYDTGSDLSTRAVNCTYRY